MKTFKCIECGKDYNVEQRYVKYTESNPDSRFCVSCDEVLQEIQDDMDANAFCEENGYFD